MQVQVRTGKNISLICFINKYLWNKPATHQYLNTLYISRISIASVVYNNNSYTLYKEETIHYRNFQLDKYYD